MRKAIILPLLVMLSAVLFRYAFALNTIKTVHIVSYARCQSELKILDFSYENFWMRNPDTDLPRCRSNLVFTIANWHESLPAWLTITLDGSSTSARKDLAYGTNEIRDFQAIFDYEDFDKIFNLNVYVTAKTEDGFLYTHQEFTHKVVFPRWLDSRVASLYITPNNPQIKQLVNEISGWPRWSTLLDWVSQNIDYRYDSEAHGTPEYWQLPTETLQLGTGDCEDYAILLCTLYRAAGYDEDSAFVIIGYGDTGHAWVRIYTEMYGIGTWINIEPQLGGIMGIIVGALNLAEYDEAYQFNDVYFTKLK